jgi:hypothetical protein
MMRDHRVAGKIAPEEGVPALGGALGGTLFITFFIRKTLIIQAPRF